MGWGIEESFNFCFEGIEEGSTVAISTLASRRNKEAFLKGFQEMCRRLNPERIICYCEPFEEIKNDVIRIPYEAELAILQKNER